MKWCFLTLTVLLACIYGALGCTCARKDPQELYCESTVAIIARVTNMTYGEGIPGITAAQFYDVEVSHVYKGDVAMGTFRVYSKGPESLCGVDLDVNKVYLLNGHISGGALQLGLCDLMNMWPLNDPDSVFPLETYYDCRCKQVPGYYSRRPKNICVYSKRFDCPSESGALGDQAECRYSDLVDDCEWQC
uniref:NTR domain-containing protein n=2 Tax=Magallana gigas TaxID=29159 RepID=A0A8W8J5S8_MAGGI|nr:metalloproteinase inhibitor 3 [Crassostrea gigas]|eukprot:XP_011426403.1 PREDICTED: metalloproteinase inhibitor 3 [Crassostrea gigas]